MAKNRRDGAKKRLWREMLKRQAASGLSVRAFCRREELTESTFYAWKRTIYQRNQETNSSAEPLTFISAIVTGEPRGDGSIVMELVGGHVLRLPESIPAQRLAELVQALDAQALAAESLR